MPVNAAQFNFVPWLNWSKSNRTVWGGLNKNGSLEGLNNMETTQNSNNGRIGGVVLGMTLALVIFWAGHVFWPVEPIRPTESSLPTDHSLTGQQRLNSGINSSTRSLLLAENTISDIAREAADSVVNIDIRSSVTVSDSAFDFGMPMRPFDLFFGPGLGDIPRKRKLERAGIGSGLIWRSEGYILTNNHVVGNAEEITVTLNDKRKFKGTVVGRDSVTDLAVVKIAAANLRFAKLGTSKNLQPGDFVIAIGSPLGYDHSVTLGIISALGRSLDIATSNYGSNVQLIQTDAAINPGNSGGPLLNIHGEVIGINQAIRGDAQNIGFAIPIDVAKEVADQLLKRGKIERPYLGIYMKELDEKLAQALGLPADTKGVVIAGMASGSPAEQSGLRRGDLVQKVEGQSVTSSKAIQQIVRSHKPGESLTFLILRDRQIKAVDLKIGAYPAKESDE
jgi:S1-C subfamily serine protease